MLRIERLVDGTQRHHGRFANRPRVADALAEHTGLARAVRRWRLKEWVGFMVVHPEWQLSFIMQDAKYLASSELFAFDRRDASVRSHEAVKPPLSLRLPVDLLDRSCRFQRGGYDLEYSFGGERGTHRIRFDVAASEEAPAVVGELLLDGAAGSAPLSVSGLLPGGSLYTYKAVFPVSGSVRIGDEDVTFDGARDLAIIDEHRSFLPYRTTWTWGTFAMRTDGGLVGANFATRPISPGAEEESALWFPGACEPLADITFTPHSDAPLSPRHIRSADGRLDVTFTPRARKEVKRQLGVFAVDYYALYGTYRGVVRGPEGEHEAADVAGVCEEMRARL